MKRFDKTPLEGNEARLNHGDSERVRLKEEGMCQAYDAEWDFITSQETAMTTDTDRIEELAKEFDGLSTAYLGYTDTAKRFAAKAVLLRSLSVEIAELRQAKESLDYLIRRFPMAAKMVIADTQDCPSYLKSRLERGIR